MTLTVSVFSTKMSFPGAGMLLSTPGRCYSELLSGPTRFHQSFQSHCLWDAGGRSLQKETCLCCSLGLAAKRKSTVLISGVSRCLVPVLPCPTTPCPPPCPTYWDGLWGKVLLTDVCYDASSQRVTKDVGHCS